MTVGAATSSLYFDLPYWGKRHRAAGYPNSTGVLGFTRSLLKTQLSND